MDKHRENKIDKKIRTTVQKILYQETYEWPPKCMAILYQPKRPEKIDSHKKQDTLSAFTSNKSL